MKLSLAILGLILAPFTAPAMAGGTNASMIMMASGDYAAMGDDMPCCSPAEPAMPDCTKACL